MLAPGSMGTMSDRPPSPMRTCSLYLLIAEALGRGGSRRAPNRSVPMDRIVLVGPHTQRRLRANGVMRQKKGRKLCIKKAFVKGVRVKGVLSRLWCVVLERPCVNLRPRRDLRSLSQIFLACPSLQDAHQRHLGLQRAHDSLDLGLPRGAHGNSMA